MIILNVILFQSGKIYFVFLIISFFAFQTFSKDKIDSLEQALVKTEGKERTELLNQLSSSYWIISPEKSIEYGNKAFELSKQTDDPKNQSLALRNIGIAYAHMSEYEKGKEYFERSLSVALSANIKSEIAQSYNSLGSYHYYSGDINKSLEFFEKALQIGAEINNKSGMISYLNNLGIIYSNIGDYNKALEYYFRSVKVSEELNDNSGLSKAYLNIGAIYNDTNDLTKALEFYNKAMDISFTINDKYLRATALNNMGSIYFAMGEFEKSLDYHKKSLLLKEEINDKYGIATSLGNIGNIYIELNNLERALDYHTRSYVMQKEIGNTEGIITSLINMGKNNLKAGKYIDALNNLNDAEPLAEKFNAKLLLEIYDLKASAYASAGNYRAAYLAHIKYTELGDSLFNEATAGQIAEIQTKYESEKKDKEINLLQRDKQINDLEKGKQAFIRNTLIAGIIVLLIIAALIFNRYRLRNNANKLLQEKITEINNQKEELKNLNSNKDKLLSIISHDLRSPFQALVGYSDLLSESIDELSKEEVSEYSRDINITSHQTLDLLDNLLEWARLQLGKIEYAPEFFRLDTLINKIVRLTMHNANRKNIMMKIEAEQDILVFADEQMITSVMHNLLTNAVKFSHAGSEIIVNVSNGNGTAKVSVIDSGIGICDADIAKLFNKNIHFSTRGTAEEKGTGLGLELCKELIEKNGGDISIESKEGKGSKFMFTVPLSK